jgi:hypothetical protein
MISKKELKSLFITKKPFEKIVIYFPLFLLVGILLFWFVISFEKTYAKIDIPIACPVFNTYKRFNVGNYGDPEIIKIRLLIESYLPFLGELGTSNLYDQKLSDHVTIFKYIFHEQIYGYELTEENISGVDGAWNERVASFVNDFVFECSPVVRINNLLEKIIFAGLIKNVYAQPGTYGQDGGWGEQWNPNSRANQGVGVAAVEQHKIGITLRYFGGNLTLGIGSSLGTGRPVVGKEFCLSRKQTPPQNQTQANNRRLIESVGDVYPIK